MSKNDNNAAANHVEKIGLTEKVAYGCGDLASNLILVLSMSFITFFYTDALGLNPGIIGTILMVSRLFDGVTDILMGHVMDKTKSKHGKARPWMLWLAIPISVCMILMFLVPNTGDFGKYVYVAITYNLVTTFLYTMINIPYGALTSLMTRDQDQRMVINIFRMFMAQFGAMLINAFTLPLVNALGGSSNQKSWVLASIIYGIIAALLFFFCFAKTKERVTVSSEQEEKISFGKSFKLIMKNNYWLLLVLIWIILAFGMSLSGAVGAYYAKYVLGNEEYAGFLGAASYIPVLIAMPIMPVFIRKFGKRNVAMIGSIFSVIFQILILVNPTSFNWLLLCSVMKGLGSATMTATLFAMIADTIEYGEWKTGTRVEGMLYSSTTFGAKVGGGVGAAIAMGIIAGTGYDGLAAVQNAATMDAIKTLFLIVPIPFMIVTPIVYAFYKLDKIYPQVMKDLLKREKEGK